MKRTAIRDLACDAIESMPRDFDWTEGYGETWTFTEAVACQKCGAHVVNAGGERHSDIDQDSDCDGTCDVSEGPMMSYWYPFAISDTDDAAKIIAHLPLCIVTVNDVTGLALTGGGMDLSWAICEAFMLLGSLPPVHFAGLPAMCGRGTSAKDRWIVAGCVKSAVVASGWALAKAKTARAALTFGRKHAAKRRVSQ
jgi:hypothetical protein